MSARGVVAIVRHFEPLSLPLRGAAVYRMLRRLFRNATDVATAGRVRIAVSLPPGNAEVTVAVPRTRGHTLMLAAVFPRVSPAALSGGFLEGAYDG
jgi:hypothetical protein